MAEPRELAQFLRSRRERVHPGDVGLPSLGRRRTPGLRREELATLAGVSIDYLIRLEQGRDTNPSAAVLAALADALRLSEEERHHLATLAIMTANAELCPAPRALENELRPTLRAVLDRLHPTPAFALGPINQVLAWNPAWDTLARPLGMLDDQRPNLTRYVFLHPRARQVLPDRARVADEVAGALRSAQTRWGSDPQFLALLDDLHAAPEFARRWDTHAVAPSRLGITRLAHPAAGTLRLATEVLTVEDADQRILTWQPADATTEAALRTLLATPLHVVRPA